LLPEELDAALFGLDAPERGSGPHPRAGGLLAAAGRGSLLLREVSELPFEVQPALFDVLQTRAWRQSLGGPKRPFAARVLATTSREVWALADDRSFHPGLFQRLASVLIRVPALRERRDDIPGLAHAMQAQLKRETGRAGRRLSAGALEVLERHDWPGNLRELRDVLTRLMLLGTREVVASDEVLGCLGNSARTVRPRRASSAPPPLAPSRSTRPKTSSLPAPKVSGIIAASLDSAALAERDRIEQALVRAKGHRERAAEMLGMSRTTLWTRMRLLGIDAESIRRRMAR
jgi:DNA-binding NtrC family response regulator